MINRDVQKLIDMLEFDLPDFQYLHGINPTLAQDIAGWILEDRKHRKRVSKRREIPKGENLKEETKTSQKRFRKAYLKRMRTRKSNAE